MRAQKTLVDVAGMERACASTRGVSPPASCTTVFLISRAGTNAQAIYYRNRLQQPDPGPTAQGREANPKRFPGGGRDVRYSSVSPNGRCTQSRQRRTPASLINMPGSAHRETLVVTHVGRFYYYFFLNALSLFYLPDTFQRRYTAQMTAHAFPGRTRSNNATETSA